MSLVCAANRAAVAGANSVMETKIEHATWQPTRDPARAWHAGRAPHNACRPVRRSHEPSRTSRRCRSGGAEAGRLRRTLSPWLGRCDQRSGPVAQLYSQRRAATASGIKTSAARGNKVSLPGRPLRDRARRRRVPARAGRPEPGAPRNQLCWPGGPCAVARSGSSRRNHVRMKASAAAPAAARKTGWSASVTAVT